ncbi:MAG: hypothetical protein H0T46_07895 [Deltaproteobacteria bacterium]|nr:hypothetical protein [Deltaproteobacteria bacterium]
MRKPVVALLLLTAACDPSTPEPSELPQGVTVLEASDTLLSAAYRQADVVVYMQSTRGKLAPASYQLDPANPVYEVDARFIADDGRIFYTRRGGDHFNDPTWEKELVAQAELQPTRTSNRLLFDMADEATALLFEETGKQHGNDRAVAVEPQITALVAIGRQGPGLFEQMVDDRKATALPGMQNEVAYGGTGGPESIDANLGANYYYLGLHAKDIDNSPAGYHSAIRIYAWQGYWAVVNDFCNHGRCPSEIPQVGIVQIANAGYKPSNWTGWTCNTGYSAYSDGGGHNCHDDSRLLMASYVYGNGKQKDPGWANWCNGQDDDTDISVNIWGFEVDQSGYPNTTDDQNRGYTHPHTCRRSNNHGYNGNAGCYCDSACLTYNDCCVDGPW